MKIKIIEGFSGIDFANKSDISLHANAIVEVGKGISKEFAKYLIKVGLAVISDQDVNKVIGDKLIQPVAKPVKKVERPKGKPPEGSLPKKLKPKIDVNEKPKLRPVAKK